MPGSSQPVRRRCAAATDRGAFAQDLRSCWFQGAPPSTSECVSKLHSERLARMHCAQVVNLDDLNVPRRIGEQRRTRRTDHSLRCFFRFCSFQHQAILKDT